MAKKKPTTPSIIADDKETECYICGHNNPSEVHHIMFGPNRQLADEDGLTVHLCRHCHDLVHAEALGYDDLLKAIAQGTYQKTHSYEEWFARYGKNYL